MNRERINYIIVNSVVILVISVILFAAGTWWRLATQYSLGEKASKRGDFAGAVAGYESAIHLYLPFHPLIEESAKKLWELGETNEKLGDINRALIAYRALRSSFYADRWFITPGMQWIERCDKKISTLIPFQKVR